MVFGVLGGGSEKVEEKSVERWSEPGMLVFII